LGNVIIVSLTCRDDITAFEAEKRIRNKLEDADFGIEKVAVLREPEDIKGAPAPGSSPSPLAVVS
jgi:hypothetical protein